VTNARAPYRGQMTPHRVVTSLLAAFVALLALFVAAAPAQAAPDVSTAAAALRGGASVYSDPQAENALTDGQVADLTAQVTASGAPMFVAVLPESAAGGSSANDVLTALHDEVGLSGIYAVVVGSQFRAGATGNANSAVSALATQALRENKADGAYAILSGFVDLVAQENNGSGSSGNSAGGTQLSTAAVALLLGFLLLVAAVVAVVIVLAVRSNARKTAAQLASVRTTIDADITTYGEQLAALDLNDPDMDDAARADLQQAFDSYDRAKSAVAAMRRPTDAGNVTTELQDGRFSLACAQARLDDQPLPERRPPCFVDPRHGPSVADVLWTPPGLTEREVPLCAACRTTVEAGGQPAGLEVATAGGVRPYYQAGPEYNGYAGGYYNSFAPVMSAVLVGTVLSSMWSVPNVTTSGVDAAGFGGGGNSGGWDFGGGGGGFGDGGFGGGDFGGGDF
jgi:hypothetical protein